MSSAHMDLLKGKGLTLDKIEEYRAAFALFDPAGTGRMSVDSLRSVLNESFEQSYADEDLQYMMRQFLPGDGSTEVDFPTFALALHSKMGDPRYNEAFGDAFDLFDKGKGGELTKEDLVYGMAKLGEKLTDAEAEEMLKIAKKKDDFVRVMTTSMTAAESMAAGGGAGSAGSAAAAPAAAAAAAPSGGGAAAASGPPRPGPPMPGGSGPPRPGGPPGPGGPRPGPPPPAAGGPPRPGGPPQAPRPPGAGVPGPPRPVECDGSVGHAYGASACCLSAHSLALYTRTHTHTRTHCFRFSAQPGPPGPPR